ncbi:MAG: hypothetical protein EZS28_007040 [Streblomastix strix]|uniref:Uncharacterized protein n=1 Tax=Streblomastix strix TaxID=222440 RepID=A0A5J4WS82_9EUKA|nr:MAG: hypothetical protein EZS28_007040 [Streblomastix strix]
MEELYQLAQSLGKIYSASDYDVFKIFEALLDDKELDDEQKQFYEQKKHAQLRQQEGNGVTFQLNKLVVSTK